MSPPCASRGGQEEGKWFSVHEESPNVLLELVNYICMHEPPHLEYPESSGLGCTGRMSFGRSVLSAEKTIASNLHSTEKTSQHREDHSQQSSQHYNSDI